MTIYNINIGIGWASSGIEYAQAYRANIFNKNKQNSKFIFTDIFHENLELMTKNIGFKDDQIIWLYQYFTDVKISSNKVKVEQIYDEFSSVPDKIEQLDGIINYYFTNEHVKISVFLDSHNDKKFVRSTEIKFNGKLIRRDFYTYVKIFSEYFRDINNVATLYQRRFFNESGSISYDEIIGSEQSLFVFPDMTIYSKENLIRYFIDSLNLSEKDLIILDRSTDIAPQVIKAKGHSKVGVVIHAEHYNYSLTNEHHILWNNYYDYELEHSSNIDFYITATDSQKELLEKQFEQYNKGNINVYSIPVGSIDKLQKNRGSENHSLITASRLASEKHIDWIIRAVVDAHKYLSDITLDIYGRGGEENKLRVLINENNANDYIRLKGHHDMSKIYKDYNAYISASTSEGFGLTLLEAVGSGLRMIGFDVPYGNTTFIKNNGLLIPYNVHEDDINVSHLSQAVIEMFELDDKNIEIQSQVSYDIAKNYLTTRIQQKWLNLEKEVLHD